MMTTQKLTLSHIKEDNKKYNEKQRIELNDHYHTYIYPNFDSARIMKMFKSLIRDFTDIKNKKVLKQNLVQVTCFMCIQLSNLVILQNSLKNLQIN